MKLIALSSDMHAFFLKQINELRSKVASGEGVLTILGSTSNAFIKNEHTWELPGAVEMYELVCFFLLINSLTNSIQLKNHFSS